MSLFHVSKPAYNLPFLQYTLLNSARSISVVTVSPPSELDDPLKCELRSMQMGTSSEDTGSCEAVSYVWGVRHSEHPIEYNGCQVDVRENHLKALRLLGYLNREHLLWIDAICINQASVPGKSAQVALMEDVYRLHYRRSVCTGTSKSSYEILHSLFRRKGWAAFLLRASPNAKLSTPRQWLTPFAYNLAQGKANAA
ncbi:hypothetical protein CORC01_02210 [Colletotrichum orchidophilum]|uniref:Heterokaryon incompatibility domain-containing protein n=1 Tax=Colletotrichum orchidophilum TaxID=1209926 RepID=A0A1G4BMF9_9PEZI|nr:uncharacterized protein CORC01_02210 [Colletotrichum orchidophilum]OHF02515.1 hypothetical protein CORC01_02210 [Colletotrichum orchidophilum]